MVKTVVPGRRDPYWDAVRGIAIIAVIYIHSSNALGSAAEGSRSWEFVFSVVERQPLNFPVALFFLLAGMFTKLDRSSPAWPWVKSRATRLLIPFLLWSTLYGLVFAVARGVSPPTWDASFKLVARVVVGATSAHLYFIAVLALFVVLTPLMIRRLDSLGTGTLILGLAAAYTAILYVYALRTGSMIPFYYYAPFGWLPFYYLGLLLRGGAGALVSPSAPQ